MGEHLTPIRLLSHRISGGVQLTRVEIDALAAIAGPARIFAKGEILVDQGESASHVWLTGEGWAFRQKMLSDGRRQIIAIMLPGELSEKGPTMPFGSPDTVVAATDLSAQSISRRDLRAVTEKYPLIQQALFYEELTRHAITREWVLLLGQRKATERLAYLIFETYARLRAMGMVSGETFDIPITQPDLADIVGMSKVHLNRTLQELRKSNLVIWSGTHVELPDTAALARLAQFDKGFEKMAQDFSSRAGNRSATGEPMEDRSSTQSL